MMQYAREWVMHYPTPDEVAAITRARLSGRALVPRFIIKAGLCKHHFWGKYMELTLLETTMLGLPRRIDPHDEHTVRILERIGPLNAEGTRSQFTRMRDDLLHDVGLLNDEFEKKTGLAPTSPGHYYS